MEGPGDPTGQTYCCGFSHMYWFSTRCTFYLFKNLRQGGVRSKCLMGMGFLTGRDNVVELEVVTHHCDVLDCH